MSAEEEQPSSNEGGGGCGILGRSPLVAVLLFATAGIHLGVGLSYWEPDNPEAKENLLLWLGLIGDMFIRSLKAIVLPMVFVSVVLSIVEMMNMGKASSIGYMTIGWYLFTTAVASTIGLISVLVFKPLFNQGDESGEGPTTVALGCNRGGYFLTEQLDGSVMCAPGDASFTDFVFYDVTNSFVMKSTDKRDDITMSQTVYSGVFEKLITDNITLAFVDGNFGAVIIFAIAFGCALGQNLFEESGSRVNNVVAFFEDFNKVLIKLINWVILATPFAVCSLIVKAIGSQNDLAGSFGNVGWLMCAAMIGFVCHFIVIDIILLGVMTKRNPFSYLKFLIPAQTTALACSSSAATLPVTLKCVEASGFVSRTIANFVCPLGSTVNMDGSAIYFPIACIWLAVLNGEEVTFASCLLLIILSTVGSAGTAPVPSAGLVLIITAYNTVFNATGTPDGFEFIVTIDWLLDRCRTALNVSGDAVVCAIVAARTDLSDANVPALPDYGSDDGEKVTKHYENSEGSPNDDDDDDDDASEEQQK